MSIQRILLTQIAISLLATGSMGCASIPKFEPSQPINLAVTLEEGLLLCREYRLPTPTRRPADLKPFLDCLNEVQKILNSNRNNLTVGIFYEELQKKFWLIQESEWTPKCGAEYETAIRAIERRMAQSQLNLGAFTPEEQELSLRLFPKTARILDASHWKTSNQVQFDPELEELYAGVGALLDRANGIKRSYPKSSVPIRPGIHQLLREKQNRNIRTLANQLTQLTSLWTDLILFSRLSQKDDREFKQILARYQKLLANAKERLDRLRMIESEGSVDDDPKT